MIHEINRCAAIDKEVLELYLASPGCHRTTLEIAHFLHHPRDNTSWRAGLGRRALKCGKLSLPVGTYRRIVELLRLTKELGDHAPDQGRLLREGLHGCVPEREAEGRGGGWRGGG